MFSSLSKYLGHVRHLLVSKACIPKTYLHPYSSPSSLPLLLQTMLSPPLTKNSKEEWVTIPCPATPHWKRIACFVTIWDSFLSHHDSFVCLIRWISSLSNKRSVGHNSFTTHFFRHSASVGTHCAKPKAFTLSEHLMRYIFLSLFYRWGNRGLDNAVLYPRSHSLNVNADLLCFNAVVFISSLLLNKYVWNANMLPRNALGLTLHSGRELPVLPSLLLHSGAGVTNTKANRALSEMDGGERGGAELLTGFWRQ